MHDERRKGTNPGFRGGIAIGSGQPTQSAEPSKGNQAPLGPNCCDRGQIVDRPDHQKDGGSGQTRHRASHRRRLQRQFWPICTGLGRAEIDDCRSLPERPPSLAGLTRFLSTLPVIA